MVQGRPRLRASLVAALIGIACAAHAGGNTGLASSARAYLDWSFGNSTGPDQTHCPQQYTATEPRCLTGGGRACLMRRAVESAKSGKCHYAMSLVLITQCHNPGAQQRLAAQSESAVCAYLASR
jgi:hypothetical protein